MSSGAAGSAVTITGSGFSAVSSDDIVTFNGVIATVTYASNNRLVVTVPPGTSSGSISIATPNGSVSSSGSFNVVPVAISGISPLLAAVGSTITISGAGFDPTASNNVVTIAGLPGTVASASVTQLQIVVPAGATSGHIVVSTSAGSASSSSVLIVPEPGYGVADIADAAQLIPGGVGHVFTVSGSSQVAVAAIDGSQGQMITAMFTNVDMGGSYEIFAPDGSILASGQINDASTVTLPSLPTAGTYALYLIPGGATGSATIKLQTDVLGTLQTDGTPKIDTLVVGQNASYTFSGVAGHGYSLEFTNFTTMPGGGYLVAEILNPDGSTQKNCGGYVSYYSVTGDCDFTLPTTGTYTVHVVAGGMFSMAYTLLLNEDFSATLTPGTPGPFVDVNLVAGQHGRFQFQATAGQTLAFYLGSVVITPTNMNVGAVLYDPLGAYVTSFSPGYGGSATFNMTNLLAGTYTVLVTPSNFNSSPSSMQVALAVGAVGNLPLDGTTLPLQGYLPGQDIFVSFAGTAGQNLGLAFTQFTLDPNWIADAWIGVTAPDTSYLTSARCYTSSSPGCEMSLRNIPQSGNYTIAVVPDAQGTLSMAFTASQDLSGALTLNDSQSIALSAAGQNATFGFTVTAGAPALIYLDSVTTTPANTAVIVYVYDSNGNLVTEGSVTANGSVNVGNVPAGNYTAIVVPNNAATATLNVTLKSAASGAIATDGNSATFSTTTPGQNSNLTFTGSAGQNLTLGLTNVSLSPGSVTSLNVSVNAPDGTFFAAVTCSNLASGCELALRNLTQTGTYSIAVQPGGSATMSFAVTLSQDISAILASGTPYNVNLASPGQGATLTFTVSTQQNTTVDVGTIAVNPANTLLSIGIYNSGGYQVTSANTSSGAAFNLDSLPAGTYRVIVTPQYPVTGTLQITAGPPAGGLLTPVDSGTGPTVTTTEPGQDAYFTFAANAGDSLSFALSGFSMAPSSAWAAGLFVTTPGGQQLPYTFCYNGNDRCELHLGALPQTGTYTVQVYPFGAYTVSFTATLSEDVAGTLAIGSSANVSLSAMGQSAALSFTLGSQQTVAVNLGSISTMPANVQIGLYVYNSSGTLLANDATTTSTSVNLPNLAAGAYTVSVVPYSPITGSLSVTLEPGAGGMLTKLATGTGANYSTSVPNQNAYFTFPANAGDNVSFAMTNFSMLPSTAWAAGIFVYLPNGQQLTYAFCYNGNPSCELHLIDLPSSGTYQIEVYPYGENTMSFTATLSADITGNLAAGIPDNLNLASMGQSATLSFTLASQQTVAVNLGGISATPAGTNMYVNVYDANWTSVGNASGASGTTLNLSSLAAGTYTVVVSPATPMIGTAQVTLEANVGGILSAVSAGSGSNYSTPDPGQNINFSFNGTAGDNLTLALTNFVISPSSAWAALMFVYTPAGQVWTYTYCFNGYSGCGVHLPNLPQTGTYTVQISPNGQYFMSFTETLSSDVGGTLVAATPFTVNLAAVGQNATLHFSTSASQDVQLHFSSLSLTPSVNLYATVFNSSGNSIAGSSAWEGSTWDVGTLGSGDYTVLITPTSQVTGSFQVTLQ